MTPAGTLMTSNERYHDSTSAFRNFTSADDNDRRQRSSSIDRLHVLVSKPQTQDRYRHNIKLGQRDRRDMTRKSSKYYESSSGSLSMVDAITLDSTGCSAEGKGKLGP
jgi:hypothetical protein